MDSSISRRSLVAGAAAAAAGLAAAGAASAAPAQAEEASEPAGQWSWSVAPEPVADSDVARTIDCDILILGLGSGGVPSSLYASLHGAKVVVMTKGGAPEANGWCWAAYNGRHNDEMGVTPYNPLDWRHRLAARTNGRCNLEMFGNMFDRSGEVGAWVEDVMADIKPLSHRPNNEGGRGGTETTHYIYYWVNDDDLSTRYVAAAEAFALMVEKAEENGAEVLYDTPAVQLATDADGNVTGAYGLDADGRYVKVNAAKGVLIATGNVKDDPEMMQYWCPVGAGLPSLTAATGSHTGDGHKMAMWVGARMDEPPVATGFSSTNWGNGVGTFHNVPLLRVNILGQRFTREDLAKGDIGANMEGQFLVTQTCYQPEKRCYQIVDSRYADIVGESKVEAFEQYVASGDIVKAGSIEELAEALGMDPDVLGATVERYNELADGGADLDFGMDTEYLEQIGGVKDAPFYAIEQSGIVGYTIGGIRTNRELQVIRTDGTAIGGLWVCGNALGGQWGNEFNYENFGATNKMAAVVGGILAVKSMLGTFDEAV